MEILQTPFEHRKWLWGAIGHYETDISSRGRKTSTVTDCWVISHQISPVYYFAKVKDYGATPSQCQTEQLKKLVSINTSVELLWTGTIFTLMQSTPFLFFFVDGFLQMSTPVALTNAAVPFSSARSPYSFSLRALFSGVHAQSVDSFKSAVAASASAGHLYLVPCHCVDARHPDVGDIFDTSQG